MKLIRLLGFKGARRQAGCKTRAGEAAPGRTLPGQRCSVLTTVTCKPRIQQGHGRAGLAKSNGRQGGPAVTAIFTFHLSADAGGDRAEGPLEDP